MNIIQYNQEWIYFCLKHDVVHHFFIYSKLSSHQIMKKKKKRISFLWLNYLVGFVIHSVLCCAKSWETLSVYTEALVMSPVLWFILTLSGSIVTSWMLALWHSATCWQSTLMCFMALTFFTMSVTIASKTLSQMQM